MQLVTLLFIFVYGSRGAVLPSFLVYLALSRLLTGHMITPIRIR
jgi:hypothetical protein